MIALFIAGCLLMVLIAWTFWAINRASPGYEDATGFHSGEFLPIKSKPRQREKRRRSPKKIQSADD